MREWETFFVWWPRRIDGRWTWLRSAERKPVAGGCSLYGDFWWIYRATPLQITEEPTK